MDSGEYRLRPHRERSSRLACPHAGWRTAGYSPLEAGSRSARRHHGCCHRTRYWNLAGLSGGFHCSGASRNHGRIPWASDRCRHLALPEQLGRNQRFASAGSLIATGLMGLIGYLMTYQAMFLIAAALGLPLLVALAAIRPADIDFARSCGAAHPDAPTQRARTTHRSLWKSPAVLTFAAGLFLFQLANAAMLPVV